MTACVFEQSDKIFEVGVGEVGEGGSRVDEDSIVPCVLTLLFDDIFAKTDLPNLIE